MTEPAKFGHTVPVSDEALAMTAETADAINRWMNATPAERAEWARQSDQRNAEQRQAAEHVPLTLDTLLTRLEKWGWSREYVEHLVQPYCECEDGRDGWEYCQHARDLGLAE